MLEEVVHGENLRSDDDEEDSLSEGDGEWNPEFDDWKEEERDFTKKLNAARGGQQGGNNLQRQGGHSTVCSKSLHVSKANNCPVILLG